MNYNNGGFFATLSWQLVLKSRNS